MSDHPNTWISAALSEIASIQMGQSPDSSSYNNTGNGLPFFQGKTEFGKLFPTTQKWCSEPKKIADSNDILLSVRAPVGPTNLAIERCCIGRGLAAIQAFAPNDQKYLLYYFRNIEGWLTKQGTGTTFSAISGDFIRGLQVPIAPLNEQKRIAEKLDRLLAKVDNCRERLDRIPLILKGFRQSILTAAISGELTANWRDEKTSDPRKWSYSTAKDLCEWITKGTTPSKDRMYEISGDVPFIKVYNLCFDGRLDFTVNPTFIDKDTHEIVLKRSIVFPGDVLMNIVGPPLGKVSIVPASHPEWNINQAIAVFRSKDKINNQFLSYVLMSQKTISDVIQKAKATAGQFNLTLEICREIIVPVPSIEEQKEIIRRVEKLFDFADRLEARYQTARAQIDKLTPALLDKAFKGELVPQDPTDEPAAALLAKIQSKSTPAKAAKTRKK
jgi:type I restriction enzyme, S subunit